MLRLNIFLIKNKAEAGDFKIISNQVPFPVPFRGFIHTDSFLSIFGLHLSMDKCFKKKKKCLWVLINNFYATFWYFIIIFDNPCWFKANFCVMTKAIVTACDIFMMGLWWV